MKFYECVNNHKAINITQDGNATNYVIAYTFLSFKKRFDPVISIKGLESTEKNPL